MSGSREILAYDSASLVSVIEWATGKRTAVAVVLFLVGGFALFQLGPYATVKQATSAPTLPEEGVTSPAALMAFLEGLDDATREAYARFQLWDLLNLALFGTTGFLVLAWLLKTTRLATSRWRWLVALPPAVAVLDLGENGVLGLALAAFPEAASTSAALPWLTGAKFAAVLLMAAAIVSLGLIAFYRRALGR